MEKLTYNPDLDVPFVRCDLCDTSEYEPVAEDSRNDFLPMYKDVDGTIYCEKCYLIAQNSPVACF